MVETCRARSSSSPQDKIPWFKKSSEVFSEWIWSMDGQEHPRRGSRGQRDLSLDIPSKEKAIPHFGDSWHLWTCNNLGFIGARRVRFQGIHGMNSGRCQLLSLPISLLSRVWKFCCSKVEIPGWNPNLLQFGTDPGRSSKNPIPARSWAPKNPICRCPRATRSRAEKSTGETSGKKGLFLCPVFQGKRGWE